MTETRTNQSTRGCFCGCGKEAEVDGWFAQDHAVTALAALRAVETLWLPHRLMEAGFGPERSVVEAAIQEAGWVRCPGCAYVGPSGAHAGTCTAGAPAGDQSPAAASGAAQGRLLPGAADPIWEAVPLHLRQQLFSR
ncbi:hypothetical protein AB0I77_15475 [Streptomyces sp. NPDC050619]|uniref:hypothetical protein n=1 Tax=Streptomyces sp. NPDC050619 TaxID=3157214 RepID=UPI003445AEC8